jgi:hypothetical protein
MKYGEQLERQSVPQWSLHNLDYNSLKHEIKVHTTRDQAAATAIAIPGHQDAALAKFEDGLFLELRRQHDRVDLFISSKADELSRRLDYLADNIKRWIAKSDKSPANPSAYLRRQRRFAKYERDLLRCGEDIYDLSRFANAQVVAFRKIVKKYKKWTGSTTLGERFSEMVLSDPKSFTRRDYSAQQQRYEKMLAELRNANPHLHGETASSSSEEPVSPVLQSRRPSAVDLDVAYASRAAREEPRLKYWNEYDDGSDAGGAGPEDEYAIYIDPENDSIFPGLGYVHAVLSLPYEKARQWFQKRRSHAAERRPLLSTESPNLTGYASTANLDSDEEGYASSEGFPSQGYAAHYALPSLADQRTLRYRERFLFWSTVALFAASFVLLGIAGVLITAGRHRLRVEVDVASTLGVVTSLFCSCSALSTMLYRQDILTVSYRLMVWSAFVASCILNGMLLILIVGNAP